MGNSTCLKSLDGEKMQRGRVALMREQNALDFLTKNSPKQELKREDDNCGNEESEKHGKLLFS